MAKRKAGRKRKSGERYECGKLRPQDDPMETAVLARQRHLGVSRESAKKRENGFAYGKALLSGDITQTQFDALETYDIVREDHKAAVDYKKQRSASDFSQRMGYDSSEGDDPEYSAWCDRTIEKYRVIRHAILTSCPQGHMAVQTWVDDNNPIWNMIPDLRLAANSIHRALNPQRLKG